jgi:hypothetical protein
VFGPPPLDELLEPTGVDVITLDVEQVAVARAYEPIVADHLPKARDVDLDRMTGRCRRLLLPERVDQVFHGDRPAGVQQQRREKLALEHAPERDPALAVVRFESSQNPEFHPGQPLPQCAKLITSFAN